MSDVKSHTPESLQLLMGMSHNSSLFFHKSVKQKKRVVARISPIDSGFWTVHPHPEGGDLIEFCIYELFRPTRKPLTQTLRTVSSANPTNVSTTTLEEMTISETTTSVSTTSVSTTSVSTLDALTDQINSLDNPDGKGQFVVPLLERRRPTWRVASLRNVGDSADMKIVYAWILLDVRCQLDLVTGKWSFQQSSRWHKWNEDGKSPKEPWYFDPTTRLTTTWSAPDDNVSDEGRSFFSNAYAYFHQTHTVPLMIEMLEYAVVHEKLNEVLATAAKHLLSTSSSPSLRDGLDIYGTDFCDLDEIFAMVMARMAASCTLEQARLVYADPTCSIVGLHPYRSFCEKFVKISSATCIIRYCGTSSGGIDSNAPDAVLTTCVDCVEHKLSDTCTWAAFAHPWEPDLLCEVIQTRFTACAGPLSSIITSYVVDTRKPTFAIAEWLAQRDVSLSSNKKPIVS
jgi:hypothetical protein